MSVVKIPKPVGATTVDVCPECSQAHADALVCDRGDGPYIICRRTLRSVSVADSNITPLEQELEITDWMPQGLAIGAIADAVCGMGGEISRLKKQIKTLAAPAASSPIVESAAAELTDEQLGPLLDAASEYLADIYPPFTDHDEKAMRLFIEHARSEGIHIGPAARPAAASIEGGGPLSMADVFNGMTLSRAEVAIRQLLELAEVLLPLVPKSKLDADQMQGVYAYRQNASEVGAHLKTALDKLATRLPELNEAAPLLVEDVAAPGADEWTPAATPPAEAGRYWCFVREQNDLGMGSYQANCSYSERHGFMENMKPVNVTHYRALMPAPLA